MPETEFTPETMRQLNREAAGMFRLEIIRPEDLFPLSYGVIAGDAGAFARLIAAAESAERIRKLAKDDPVICLCCPRSIRDPESVLALLIPASGTPTTALASAICHQCSAADNAALIARAAASYEAVCPGLRCIEITHPEGGRA
jgi:hypothetical protein